MTLDLDLCNVVPMSSVYIAVGTAPVGSTVTEWDWAEDECGYRTKSYYDLIPDRAVTVLEVIQAHHELTWANAKQMVLDTLADLVASYSGAADPLAFMVSVSAGDTCICSTWGTVTDTLNTLNIF